MPSPSLTASLVVVFLGFFAIIMIFAVIYSRMYATNAAHFSFNSEILVRQKQVIEKSSREELSDVTKKLVLMSELVAAIAQRNVTLLFESAPNDIVLSNGRRYFFWRMSGGAAAPAPPSHWLTVFDEKNEKLSEFVVNACPDGSLEKLIDIAKAESSALEKRVGAIENRIASIPTSDPDVWRFIDFLYFSTVIQTTVGLGDILPNSTTVRSLVVLQVMVGYGILIVALNIVLNNH